MRRDKTAKVQTYLDSSKVLIAKTGQIEVSEHDRDEM